MLRYIHLLNALVFCIINTDQRGTLDPNPFAHYDKGLLFILSMRLKVLLISSNTECSKTLDSIVLVDIYSYRPQA